MTVINALKNQLKRDIRKQKGIIQKDKKQHFLHWNENRKAFIGIDEKGTEWIAGPKTDVPCYWIYCPNTIEFAHNGEMKSRRCNKPHFVPIYRDGDKLTCVECGNTFTVEIILSPDTPQNHMLQRIREEKKGIE